MTSVDLRGWMGGTFDPIHLGHLDVASAAREALGLTRVTLVPARIPPHRPQPTASAEHRVAMARLATQGQPAIDVSTFEIDGDGPSFTAVTLDRLAAAGQDLRALVIITGADAFAGILSWHRVDDILDSVTFAVVSRPGHPATRLRTELPALAGRMCEPDDWSASGAPSIVLIDAPTAPVSSTAIRAAAAAGQPLTGLVPPAVEEYISAHRLYSR